MRNDRWLATAITSDTLVAELLLNLKRSSSSNSSSPSTTVALVNFNPPGWGDRKSRSKSTAVITVEKLQQQRSPCTPLSWSGGGDLSNSDGNDESCRSSDLFSGNRSGKINLHQNPKTECETGSEVEMKKRRCMLPDLNETPVIE